MIMDEKSRHYYKSRLTPKVFDFVYANQKLTWGDLLMLFKSLNDEEKFEMLFMIFQCNGYNSTQGGDTLTEGKEK